MSPITEDNFDWQPPSTPSVVPNNETNNTNIIRQLSLGDTSDINGFSDDPDEVQLSENDIEDTVLSPDSAGIVYERSGKVIGCLTWEIHGDIIEITNIAVKKELRGKLVGSELVDSLIDSVDPETNRLIQAKVKEVDLPAQLFFFKQRFEATMLCNSENEENNEVLMELITELPEEDNQNATTLNLFESMGNTSFNVI
ncbi:GNAT family N-acetyltransferase [Candidatus Peregrinibacteria bacterium]|jgi:ribosomal protein S18 acetylase RimI-like enzyme|nr:GNAT family N-acetyltransferase [Candidatus Peregrinibacteria bacterium]MBT3598647.1 GNAT family N-acetyltransferase [Candidatus Peregrinibacteria bacterium]MBT4367707.1 GNAT family N-acetyltransferase [Candidatus Peregrinibacteria bacterium]MBT4585755.1 GNAT family N-acetyltransferase [Candidatus Peregrinibacteria bacterium]MBT6730954.1 GNAT family N-acetyltransferase [Candidatus Peregrinibacteria bacterium]